MADRPPLVVINGQVQRLAATDAVSGVVAIKSISAGTTRATNGEVVLSNSNGLSFGLNGNTITASYTVPTETPFGISAGSQSASTGTIVFSNSNGITFGLSGSSRLTASYSQSTTPAAIAAGSQTATSGTIAFANSNGVTFGMSGSSQITAAVSDLTISYFAPWDGYVQVTGTQGQSTVHVQPAIVPRHVQFDRVAFPIFFSGATNSTATVTLSYWFGLYTQNVSSLSLASSTSFSSSWVHSGNFNAGNQQGVRLITAGWTNTITAGQYWAGLLSITATAGAAVTLQQMLASQNNSSFSGIFGAPSNLSNQYTLGLGAQAGNATAVPANIALSNIRGQSSGALRPPLYMLMSGTV